MKFKLIFLSAFFFTIFNQSILISMVREGEWESKFMRLPANARTTAAESLLNFFDEMAAAHYKAGYGVEETENKLIKFVSEITKKLNLSKEQQTLLEDDARVGVVMAGISFELGKAFAEINKRMQSN